MAQLDRLPIHDIAASTAALAKSWRAAIDRSKAETAVPTETLILWLDTIIDYATPQASADLDQRARRTVMGLHTEASEAIRARDDDDERARLG